MIATSRDLAYETRGMFTRLSDSVLAEGQEFAQREFSAAARRDGVQRVDGFDYIGQGCSACSLKRIE